MTFLKKLYYLFLLITLSLILKCCANRKSPTGGPKDEKSPEITKTIPVNKSLNYRGKKLYFEFDEYVKEENLKDKIIISPSLENTFTYKIIKNRLTIEFDKNLKDSTTYTINLGPAIKDITEGNLGKNLVLTFSTGDQLDSLNISGQVTEINTGKGIKDILVGIYNSRDTLNVFNAKPLYISKTDEEGKFILQNLKADPYVIYAFNDIDKNLKYSNHNEGIGFISDTLKLSKSIENLKFPLQKFDLRMLKVIKNISENNIVNIDFNKGVTYLTYKILPDTSKIILHTLKNTKDRLTLFNTINATDSLNLFISAKDSFDIKLDTTIKIFFKKEEENKKNRKDKEEKKRSFNVEVKPGSGQMILNTSEIEVNSDLPIIYKDISKIYFSKDSLTKYPLDAKDLTWNKGQTSFKVNKDFPFADTIFFNIEYNSLRNVKYDTASENKIIYLKKRSDQFSSIGGTFNTKESHFIIQLKKKENNEVFEIKNKKDFKFDYLDPGTYSLRVLIDQNKNGKWDRGDLKKRIEPERIVYFVIVDSKNKETNEITIKANWEILDNTINDSE